jgi:heme/copper-type cytochrome/quinol oxidase subunit 2
MHEIDRVMAWLSLWLSVVLLTVMLWLAFVTTSRRAEGNAASTDQSWLIKTDSEITPTVGENLKRSGRMVAPIREHTPRRFGRQLMLTVRYELTKIQWKREPGWNRSAVLSA